MSSPPPRSRVQPAAGAADAPRQAPSASIFLIAAGAAVLAVGAVTFSIIRRSTQPDPSPRPPSVEVSAKPDDSLAEK